MRDPFGGPGDGRPPGSEYGMLDGNPTLTAREQDIVSMLVSGLTAKEVAADLEISFHTVRTHIRNIYTKLGVANRVELVRLSLGN